MTVKADANQVHRDFGAAALRDITDGVLPDQNAPTAVAVQPLVMTLFDDAAQATNKRWIMKGLIARGETSSLIGPPGCGKSALEADLAVHCARQADFLGHRAKEKCGVLVLALERGDLYERRFAAYRQRDQVTGLPIAIVKTVVDLLNPSCVDVIAVTLCDATRRLGHEVGLLIIDTYNKGIAIGGGDEDKAKDQNRVAAHLRKLHELANIHIALVGHTGKDESRGARGSNAHLGDVDLMVQISGDSAVKTAKVTKANDQPEREIATFRMKPFVLGQDEDGDPIDVVIIDVIDSGPAAAMAKPAKQLTNLEKAGLRELNECVADHVEPPPNDPHCPPGSKGVALETWRGRLRQRSVIGKKGEKGERTQFMRIKDGLRDKGRIGIWDDYVWPVCRLTA
ncbi:AAA family ATPase [Bradyrhizobium septentrionale]|uniref:AAA family ATPase n=1 Tax=Bradyrhizobium septentrionale TaxID=1404411 RepID=UPI001596FEE2|nr:AAA family ATPase [Bradyrhizobium septentrionale]UGY25374.1 AAA family ATPase [Bradyrhizobium septentrionale]